MRVREDPLGALLADLGAEDGREPPTARRPERRVVKALALLTGCVVAAVVLVMLGFAVLVDVVWPRTAVGTCFVLEPGWCSELTVDGVDRWGRVSLPIGSVVLDSGSADFWGKSVHALVRVPEGQRVSLSPVYGDSTGGAGLDAGALARAGVGTVSSVAFATDDRWSYTVVQGLGADGFEYVYVTAEWNA